MRSDQHCSLSNVFLFNFTVVSRETREGWSLLTVETEVNGDSKSTNERGPSTVTRRIVKFRYIHMMTQDDNGSVRENISRTRAG